MNPTYEDEEKIIWLKDHDALARMGYVRERWLLCPIRTGPVKAPPGEMLIGYAILKKTAAKADERGFSEGSLLFYPRIDSAIPKVLSEIVCRQKP